MSILNPPPSSGMEIPRFSHLAKAGFFFLMECAMWVLLFSIFVETISLMSHTYLGELPLIGSAFNQLDPDANASHILAALLAFFSVATPIFIWHEILRQDIWGDPQGWICHPQNQISACIAAFILLLVVGLEVTNIYTLIARESAPNGFITNPQTSGVMSFLAQNKGLAIAVSLIMVVINLCLAFLTTKAFHTLSNKG